MDDNRLEHCWCLPMQQNSSNDMQLCTHSRIACHRTPTSWTPTCTHQIAAVATASGTKWDRSGCQHPLTLILCSGWTVGRSETTGTGLFSCHKGAEPAVPALVVAAGVGIGNPSHQGRPDHVLRAKAAWGEIAHPFLEKIHVPKTI